MPKLKTGVWTHIHKGGSCSATGLSQPRNFLKVSLSPQADLKKNMNWHCQWGAKFIIPIEAKHLALLPTPQLCHILSFQPPDHTHFTPQSSLITEKSFRNVMASLTHTWHPSSSHSKAHGDSRALHVPGAKQLNPVSQERRRWCAERQVENHGLILHNGPQLLLEDAEDFQLKHWRSQRSGTRAARAGKRDGESVKVPD